MPKIKRVKIIIIQIKTIKMKKIKKKINAQIMLLYIKLKIQKKMNKKRKEKFFVVCKYFLKRH